MASNLFTFPPQKTSKLNIPDNEPIYRVTGKGFFDGATLLTEYDELGRPTLIAYDGKPNFNLLPMNELALSAVEDWLKELAEGTEEAKKSADYSSQGGARSGVMTQEIDIRSYMSQIADSGRFESKRIEPAILSNKINKATTRVIDQTQIDTPEIKSVSTKKRDQTSMINGN
jgi:hypothetical protein